MATPETEFTQSPTHGWTMRELDDKFEALEQFLEERDRRYEARFVSMDERDKRYDERAVAQKEAITAALNAAEKATSAAFAASEKAVLKAEESQRGVNASTNEFRGQLKDQNDTMMPRAEAMSALVDIRDRVERETRDRNVLIDSIRSEIRGLSEARSEGAGRASQQQQSIAANHWTITAIIGAAALLVGLFSSGILNMNRAPAVVAPAPPVIIVQPSPPAAPSGPVAGPGGSVTDSRSTTVPKQ